LREEKVETKTGVTSLSFFQRFWYDPIHGN